MCETQWHYSPKALKKKFKDMTFCYDCTHLDGFESVSKHSNPDDRVAVCCSCGSENVVRRRTLVFARTWIPAKVWRERTTNSAPTGGETVTETKLTPLGNSEAVQ